jgi:hypothetical protein
MKTKTNILSVVIFILLALGVAAMPMVPAPDIIETTV